MPQKMRWIIFSALLALTACNEVKRPDTDLCVLNTFASPPHGTCFNLLRDYNDDGTRKRNAQPTIKIVNTIADINKVIYTDPQGWANFKAYVNQLKEEANPSQEIVGSIKVFSWESELQKLKPEFIELPLDEQRESL